MAYFLISVSSRRHLDLCIRYALAGFTNSVNGVWTYSDIQVGDYISFLYGARAHNLYRVEAKRAHRDAEHLPPWEPITFRMSGLTYYFPFRLRLLPVRQLGESLVRAEFSYVAENLLLRGGYRKTHFQADQTTLQSVSQLGSLYEGWPDALDIGSTGSFVPRFVSRREAAPPETFRLFEVILQAAIRHHLSEANNLDSLLTQVGMTAIRAGELEVLGEKALPEGHIDLLIKEATPIGMARSIIAEVKTGRATLQDVAQLRVYLDEMGKECLGGVLIARSFSKKVLEYAGEQGMSAVEYSFGLSTEDGALTFHDLRKRLRLAVLR